MKELHQNLSLIQHPCRHYCYSYPSIVLWVYIYILRLEDSLRCSSLSYSPCFVTQGHSLKHAACPLCLARWSASPRDFSITVSQDREITNAYPKIVSFYMCSGDQNQYHVIAQQTFNQLSYRLSPQPLI